jgi:pimeloyl-ACP methyl ester carboxylesterase
MPYTTVDSIQIFYTCSQSREPNAPTLMLIHGAGGSHVHWPPGLRRLPGVTVYALDLPGHGRSEEPGCAEITDYVSFLIGFMDAAATNEAVLLGHSMGGAVSQMTALKHPQRVKGLVLIGTGARLRVAPAILEGIRRNFKETIDLITRWAWAKDAPADLVQLGHGTLAHTPPQVLLDDFAACDNFDVMDRLGRIDAPTLIIAGTADRLTPHKFGAYLADHIPNAQLVTIEGGGHMMALEQPGAVTEAVARFIQQLA